MSFAVPRSMNASAVVGLVATFVSASTLVACDGAGDATVACRLDAYNQCLEWIHLPESQVGSLRSTCVNDDGGEVVDSCPTDNIVGTCEDDGGPGPASLNYFYLPGGQDPVTYGAAKGQACEDSGGVWNPT